MCSGGRSNGRGCTGTPWLGPAAGPPCAFTTRRFDGRATGSRTGRFRLRTHARLAVTRFVVAWKKRPLDFEAVALIGWGSRVHLGSFLFEGLICISMRHSSCRRASDRFQRGRAPARPSRFSSKAARLVSRFGVAAHVGQGRAYGHSCRGNAEARAAVPARCRGQWGARRRRGLGIRGAGGGGGDTRNLRGPSPGGHGAKIEILPAPAHRSIGPCLPLYLGARCAGSSHRPPARHGI